MTVEWLLVQYRKAAKDFADGAALMSGGSGDANYSKSIQVGASTRMRALYHDLSVLDPETYPPEAIVPTRTRATFAGNY